MNHHRRHRRTTAALGGLIIIWLGSATGCYERVVDDDAPVRGQSEVYEPNLKDDRIPIVEDLEDAVFGEP